MLDDLIQISPRPLSDLEQFLAEWIAFLRAESGADADTWLREAVRLSQGTRGLEALARTEGQARPRAYLDWFTALEREGKHGKLLAAAQEALQTLAPGLPIRAAIADHLCAAAVRLDDREAQCAGRWEAFLVQPTLPRLLDLWDVVAIGEERTAMMQQAVQHIREYLAHPPDRQAVAWPRDDGLESPVWIDSSVLAHAYLLVGDFEAAQQLAAGQPVLGWSSRSCVQGLVVAAFLALLSGEVPGALPSNVAQTWKWGLENSAGYRFGGEAPVRQRLEEAYADKAAILTAACAEVLRARGDKGAADTFVNEIRNRFPRHRAFQAELETALRGM
jgi:hypothetical protein